MNYLINYLSVPACAPVIFLSAVLSSVAYSFWWSRDNLNSQSVALTESVMRRTS